MVQPDIKWAGGMAGGTGEVLERARQGGSVTDAAMSIWRRATGKLFDLESRIVMQVCYFCRQKCFQCCPHLTWAKGAGACWALTI